MSRSYKKNNYSGNTHCRSEKKDKRSNNRKIRRVNKKLLEYNLEEYELIPKKTLTNLWDMGKDGKSRITVEKCGKEYYNKLKRK